MSFRHDFVPFMSALLIFYILEIEYNYKSKEILLISEKGRIL